MARTARTTRVTEAVPARRGRPPGSGKTAAAAAAAKPKTTARLAAPRRAAAPPPPPKVSKDELRAQVEKLAHANATLRSRSREAGRAAKSATARIEELEAEVARLERKLAAAKPGTAAPQPARAARGGRRPRERDPGDAVPPGVAVEEPAALDEDAKEALAALQELGDE